MAQNSPEINIGHEQQLPPRSEYTPERSPKPLKKGLGKGIEQLKIIAEKPTQHQIDLVAQQLKVDGLEETENPQDLAKNTFENFKFLLSQRDIDRKTYKTLRREALSAPNKDQLNEKMELLEDARKQRSKTEGSIKEAVSFFREAGVQLEPEQKPLTLTEKAQVKAFEAGWNIAAGEYRAEQSIKAGMEAVEALGRKSIEMGRQSLKSSWEAGLSSLRVAGQTGEAAFNKVAGFTIAAAEKGVQIVRQAEKPITFVGHTVSTFATAVSRGLEQKKTAVVNNAQELLVSARSTAAANLEGFLKSMQSAGEAARGKWDSTSQAVLNFAGEQAKRVDYINQQIKSRVSSEINQAIEKSKVFLAPALAAIQRDRGIIRNNFEIVHDKLGLVAEEVSDFAAPLIDPILDEGRDLRDSVLGFSGQHIEGMRVFGRKVGQNTHELTNSALTALNERWADLAVRANDSRGKLNSFMSAALGSTALPFKMVGETVGTRAERAKYILSGIELKNGHILYQGKEVPPEVAKWFTEQGSMAREFFRQNKEKVGEGLEGILKFIPTYAAGRWKESGLSGEDIKRRLKVLRAVEAASLGRAAKVFSDVGTTVDNAFILQRLAQSPKGMALLGSTDLIAVLATNPEIRYQVKGFLEAGNWSAIKNLVAGENTANPNSPTPEPSSPPATTNSSEAAETSQPSNTHPTSGLVDNTQPTEYSSVPEDINEYISTLPPEKQRLVYAAISIAPGKPVKEQVEKFAPEGSEDYFNILGAVFDYNINEFRRSAQAVIDSYNGGEDTYTQEEFVAAQKQLQAIDHLLDHPLLPAQTAEETFINAMHYWRSD